MHPPGVERLVLRRWTRAGWPSRSPRSRSICAARSTSSTRRGPASSPSPTRSGGGSPATSTTAPNSVSWSSGYPATRPARPRRLGPAGDVGPRRRRGRARERHRRPAQARRGLRPSSLDHGLRAALDDLASRTPTPVRLDVTPQRFTPEIETAATSSPPKGSPTPSSTPRPDDRPGSRPRAGQLVVAVDDDGLGGADLRRGTGLVGLADRARSHGGTLEITSRPGAGTSLRATLPCG